ncbi:hypothetical protein SELSPUOL_02133 [Selenomonas sputigena ATCC 35185]|uniref:Uncharacterized protein n=1 Tax=Selenomonas sputigena (strain ATCC 35185 / DSM 20758 / CCUG 44933 / VPI D19B-28) TaxID=546271 RepID=C9LXC5_SELS3|nr:hypothetical protein SELSPUOL_02133 [Selenomonas sputigena ATCC 35185]
MKEKYDGCMELKDFMHSLFMQLKAMNLFSILTEENDSFIIK